MKACIAMFERNGYTEWRAVLSRAIDSPEGDNWTLDGYTRISEWVDVELTALAPEVIVPAQLAALDREAEAVRKEFTEKLHEIAERRASLLALTHESAA